MTDIPIATKEHPAPLDAFETAKPDEPLFTLQGGDPLAAPLVQLWAMAARCRAGLIPADKFLTKDTLNGLTNAAIRHSVAGDERERDNLKVRATAAEEVSWAMDDYRNGHVGTDVPTEAADTHLSELQRIDLYELKVRAAQKLSSFRSELREIREALEKAGLDMVLVPPMFEAVDRRLGLIKEAIEPRRMFKK
jgi:hypothetical protein